MPHSPELLVVGEPTETARVYTTYETLPPQCDGWTRFVCLSDTHSNRKFHVPHGDVLLHAGDLSSWGTPKQLYATLDWLVQMPHTAKM